MSFGHSTGCYTDGTIVGPHLGVIKHGMDEWLIDGRDRRRVTRVQWKEVGEKRLQWNGSSPKRNRLFWVWKFRLKSKNPRVVGSSRTLFDGQMDEFSWLMDDGEMLLENKNRLVRTTGFSSVYTHWILRSVVNLSFKRVSSGIRMLRLWTVI